MTILDVGGGHESRAKQFYPLHSITTIDLENGYDVMKQGLPKGNWDIIFANHFIEHVADPDYFLDECHKIMNKNTILEIGTPNLCAWFNRILFLFGYLPHSYEVSYRHAVGRAFNWNEEEVGGHLRVFSIPALCQLLKLRGFKVLSITGEASTYPANPAIMMVDKVLTRLSPEFASAFRVKCRLRNGHR